MTICEALARDEGFYVPGSRANRNNNPGNVCYGKFAIAHGAIGLEKPPADAAPTWRPRFAVFPSPEVGFAAQHALLEAAYAGLTIRQMYYKYSPPSDHNNTEQLIANLCKMTGLPENTIIDQYL